MATETVVTVWGMSLSETDVSPFSEALVYLGFPSLKLITDGNSAGGTRTSGFSAWSACFRSTNGEGNMFPVEHILLQFMDLAKEQGFEGGIVVDDDPSGDTHTLLFSSEHAKLNNIAKGFGIIHLKD